MAFALPPHRSLGSDTLSPTSGLLWGVGLFAVGASIMYALWRSSEPTTRKNKRRRKPSRRRRRR